MKKFYRPQFCLFPDPADGASAVESPAPAPEVDSVAPPASAEPPPAATVVVNGEITEEVVKLRKRTADLENDKKKVEIRACELEDENRRLKNAGLKPAAAAEDKRSALEKFMETGETD